MPILIKPKKKHRGFYTIDLSTTGQGPGPYPMVTASFFPANGASFVTGSDVILTVVPGHAYTGPAYYTFYSASEQVGDIDSLDNGYNFGSFAGESKLNVLVEIKNAVSNYTASWTASIYHSVPHTTHTPTPTPTPSPTLTSTPTVTPTPSMTPTLTLTSTSTPTPTMTPTVTGDVLPTSMTFEPSPNETWADGTDFSVTGSAVGGTAPFTYQWWSSSIALGTEPSQSFGAFVGPTTCSFVLDAMNDAGTASFTWTGKVNAA